VGDKKAHPVDVYTSYDEVVVLYRIIPTVGLPGRSAVVPTFNFSAPAAFKVML
jgi:hypothetical protein